MTFPRFFVTQHVPRSNMTVHFSNNAPNPVFAGFEITSGKSAGYNRFGQDLTRNDTF